MKKIMMILAMLAVVAGVATAAPKEKAEKKIVTVAFTTDLDCHHCAQKVLNTIPYEKGVKDVQVDVAAKSVTVTYDPAKTNNETLVKAFAKIKIKAEAKSEAEQK